MVIEEHEEFAREVTELARKHGVQSYDMTFRLDSFKRRNQVYERECFEQVRAHWHDGRHGIAAPITLKTEAAKTITEKERNPRTEGDV